MNTTRFPKKSLRYLRWISKAVFLLLFMVPIAYVPAGRDWAAPMIPVTSLLFPPSQPYFQLPVTISPCSIWLAGYCEVIPGTWFVEPLGNVQALITGNVGEILLIPTIICLLIVIGIIVLLGAAFCSWMCPLGTIIDSFDKFIERFLPKIEAQRNARYMQNRNKSCTYCPITKIFTQKNGYVAGGILASIFVGSAILRFNIFCTVCPIGIATRGLFHLKSTTYVSRVYLAKQVTYPFFVEFFLVIPVIAVLLSLRARRFWCNKLCPVGAIISGISTLNPFIKPKINHEKCIMKGCPSNCKDNDTDYCGACRLMDDKKCEKVCPAGLTIVDGTTLHRCTKCMECYIECDYGAVEIGWVGKPDIFKFAGKVKALRKRKQTTI